MESINSIQSNHSIPSTLLTAKPAAAPGYGKVLKRRKPKASNRGDGA